MRRLRRVQQAGDDNRAQAALELEAELGADAPPGVSEGLWVIRGIPLKESVHADEAAARKSIDGYVGPICK